MPTPPAALLTTLKLLALLPGVKPRVAKDRLYGALLNAVLAQRSSFNLWPSEVSVADCDEIFIPDCASGRATGWAAAPRCGCRQ